MSTTPMPVLSLVDAFNAAEAVASAITNDTTAVATATDAVVAAQAKLDANKATLATAQETRTGHISDYMTALDGIVAAVAAERSKFAPEVPPPPAPAQ